MSRILHHLDRIGLLGGQGGDASDFLGHTDDCTKGEIQMKRLDKLGKTLVPTFMFVLLAACVSSEGDDQLSRAEALPDEGVTALDPDLDDSAPMMEEQLPLLFDFTQRDAFKSWRTVDDRVMGGVSRSRLFLADGFATFQGNLSLENNGGFASVRSPELDDTLEDVDKIRLKVRGDGRSYQLSIRTDRVFDGVRYRTSFETEADVWQEVVLSLEDFRPTWRGRRVPGAPELFAPDIRSFGFMVADKQAGQFRLDVEWLGAE